ncbi:MAG: XoxI protein [Clostridia bacterium]
MNFKKILTTNLVLMGIITSPIMSFANGESLPDVYSTETKMIDTRPIPYKSTIREPLKDFVPTLKAAPVNTSNIICKNSIASGTYALAKSSSTVKEDYIYAKVRVYNGAGSLNKSKASSENKSSYTSATVNPDCYLGNAKAYGNHTYKLNGYKDIYHETVGRW